MEVNIMMNYDQCGFITYYRGFMANDYDTHYEYVEDGAWEKDYFADWLASCSDYPSLDEIEHFCHQVQYYMGHWFDGVKAGKIDSEAGVEE
jgi:hypothetical protein